MPIEHKPDENNYFIDAESATEMTRLINQDRLFTENMGGLFPERNDVSSMHDILDIACGPGGWVLEVATAFGSGTNKQDKVDCEDQFQRKKRSLSWSPSSFTALTVRATL